MSINQLQPHYFAIAGMNDYIYLHDKRMLPSQSQHHTTNNDTSESLKCVKRFSPSLDGTNRPNKHITACRFSDANGYEVDYMEKTDPIKKKKNHSANFDIFISY